MKYLKKFFESLEDIKEDILENFLFISDKFGDPGVHSSKYGDKNKWTLTWDINLDFSVLQEANQLIKKLKDITEDIDDVIAASGRLEDYNVNMSLTSKLKIELVPKDIGGNTFKFIEEYESRQLFVRINEFERFFNSKGLRVVKWDIESSYNEYNQTNQLEITLDKNDGSVMSEFGRLVMAELNLIGDRKYIFRFGGPKSIVIYPDQEKSYVEISYA
jgi:hypothetical protein